MSINIPVPQTLDYSLYQLLAEILRRALDDTVAITINVAFSTNQDITVTDSTKGIVFTVGSGDTYRLNIVEVTGEDGSLNGVVSVSRVS